MQWEQHDTLICGRTSTIKTLEKFACFDLDGTLIIPKIYDHKFVRNSNDWKFIYDNTCDILNKLDTHGFQIVIFTNQAGIKIMGIDNYKQLIENIQRSLNINIIIYIATAYDIYRKPYPTMWEIFLHDHDIKSIDFHKTFYCGDACGRPDDFSDSDYKFSLNCNINFYVPDYLFANQLIYPELKYFNFSKYMIDTNKKIEYYDNEIIIVIGNYATGKTYFVNKYFSSYEIITPTLYSSTAVLQNNLNALMKQNKRIIIDGGDWTKENRKMYITIAKLHNYTCRCIVMICPILIALHNTLYNHYISNGKNPKIHEKFIFSYRDEFEFPAQDEGFDKIIKHQYVIDKSIDLSKYMLYFVETQKNK